MEQPIFKYDQETTQDGLILVVCGEKYKTSAKIKITEKESKKAWGFGLPIFRFDITNEKLIEEVDYVTKHIYRYDPKIIAKN